jgi:HTH-type transcriptional repressor of NAD biosynthesis genes
MTTGKRFASSLVLGKFMPLHAGHVHVVREAAARSDKVHVVVCHHPGQPIPGAARLAAARLEFSGVPGVAVHELRDDGMPQSDRECGTLDEFYSLWVPPVLALTGPLDAVFTSEPYGPDFARYLGAEHVEVDRGRSAFPVSGTAIRMDPAANWDMLAAPMRAPLVRRVAIMGTESCGKSTLTERLAGHYGTRYVEEWGRVVYERNGGRVGIEDFVPIAQGRQELEDRALPISRAVLFCDTEDITTYLFSRMYCPGEWRQSEAWFERAIAEKPPYDLYILLSPDCPAVQDGTRNFLEERWEHHGRILEELRTRGRRHEVVGGGWEERFARSVALVDEMLRSGSWV